MKRNVLLTSTILRLLGRIIAVHGPSATVDIQAFSEIVQCHSSIIKSCLIIAQLYDIITISYISHDDDAIQVKYTVDMDQWHWWNTQLASTTSVDPSTDTADIISVERAVTTAPDIVLLNELSQRGYKIASQRHKKEVFVFMAVNRTTKDKLYVNIPAFTRGEAWEIINEDYPFALYEIELV